MDNSLLLARLIGPFILVISIGLIFNRAAFLRIMDDFPKSPALVFVTGLFTFASCLAVVIFHNVWVADWRVIITVFGWAGLVKGAWLVILPGAPLSLARKYAENFKLVLVPWVIMLLAGIMLSIKGFM